MILEEKPAKRIELAGRIIEEGGAFVIAEMACAHDGDFGKAKELISVAATAQVDAVQLQIFNAAENMVAHHSLRPVLEKIEFNPAQWGELVSISRVAGLPVFACAYDFPSLELALRLGVDGIKFNSADLGNQEMLVRCAQAGVAFTLGTGASRMDEVGQALSTVLQHGADRVVLMHGIQAFPTRIDKASIQRITTLRESFDALVGYADHTDGDDGFAQIIDLVAVGAGACVLEKHFTLDRASKGLDYQAALNPDQLESYVRDIRIAVRALGNGWPMPFDDDDRKYRQFQKKQIVAAHELPVGCVLDRSKLALLRTETGEGLDAAALSCVLGKTLRRALRRHELVRTLDIE